MTAAGHNRHLRGCLQVPNRATTVIIYESNFTCKPEECPEVKAIIQHSASFLVENSRRTTANPSQLLKNGNSEDILSRFSLWQTKVKN